MTKTKTVYLKLVDIRPDPVQYKPYNPTLCPPDEAPMYVAIQVGTDHVIEHAEIDPPKNATILTPAGLAHIMGEIAKAISLRLSR
jgi:hypothetical protein